MLATEYAKHYEIDPQHEGESDVAFKSRVAGALRAQDRLIEAHETYQDERYEESDDVMTGLLGALGQAMQGIDYGSYDERKIGDDIASGIIVKSPNRDDALMALMALMLFGDKR